jgi:hypothetical protein
MNHTTQESSNEIPYGYCHCGCGQKTNIAPQTALSKGWTKGKPVRFVTGHNIAPHRNSLEEAFWAYCTPGAPDDCWLWQGPTYKDYGFFKWQNVRYYAHRIAYELHYGTILVGENPRDTSVCHTCDTPTCCNPAHLFLGTQSDNARDMVRKGRQAQFPGSKHGNAKLTEQDVAEIRQRVNDGEPQINLAREYGVSTTTVCSIVKRKSWKHVI